MLLNHKGRKGGRCTEWHVGRGHTYKGARGQRCGWDVCSAAQCAGCYKAASIGKRHSLCYISAQGITLPGSALSAGILPSVLMRAHQPTGVRVLLMTGSEYT